MDDKLVIETLVKAIKKGTLKFEDVPNVYKEKVQEKLNEEA